MPKSSIKSLLISLSLFFTATLSMSTFVSWAADVTAPTMTFVRTPSIANGKNSWYVSPVTYTLTATDLESGVQEIDYRIDSAPWQKATFEGTLNLAPNPSFEDADINSPINTQYWKHTATNQGDVFSRDVSVYAPGYDTVSIKITTPAPGWHSIDHADYFAVSSSYKNMTASIWAKTDSVVGNVYFKVFAVSKDSGGNNVYTEIARSNLVTGTSDWLLLSQNFVVNQANAIGVFLQPGIEGKGTVWFDAASINDAVTSTTATLSVATDGNHTVQFYAIDRAGNSGIVQSDTIKIDQTPPGNWHDSGATRGLTGSDHELYVYTNVEDETSGISTFTDKYQYITEKYPTFGFFSDLIHCNSTWNVGGWQILISPPFFPGAHSAYIITPKTDFCNSNWKICKVVRFYSEDMAGNVNIKDFCINGPWIKFAGGGAVGVNNSIDMLSESDGTNTDGLVETNGSTINFFTTTKNWIVKNSSELPSYSYSTFWNAVKATKTTISTSGNLVAGSGIYYINGSYTITNSNVPNSYGSNTFNQVVFVNGDLTINRDISVANGSTALFIVKGKVKVAKAVENVKIGIFADDSFYTAYDKNEGDTSKTLYLNGVFAANRFYFQRTLQGTQNDSSPSEYFTFEPKYIVKVKDYIGTSNVTWLSSQ